MKVIGALFICLILTSCYHPAPVYNLTYKGTSDYWMDGQLAEISTKDSITVVMRLKSITSPPIVLDVLIINESSKTLTIEPSQFYSYAYYNLKDEDSYDERYDESPKTKFIQRKSVKKNSGKIVVRNINDFEEDTAGFSPEKIQNTMYVKGSYAADGDNLVKKFELEKAEIEADRKNPHFGETFLSIFLFSLTSNIGVNKNETDEQRRHREEENSRKLDENLNNQEAQRQQAYDDRLNLINNMKSDIQSNWLKKNTLPPGASIRGNVVFDFLPEAVFYNFIFPVNKKIFNVWYKQNKIIKNE
jgi:hypothetical protein